MKANGFVKKFGWYSLKIAVTLPRFYRYKYVIFYSDEIDFKNEFIEKHKEYMFETQEVKRLIESYKLVEAEGGLLNVKNSFQMERDCGGVDLTPFGEKLYQAILDVESCQ